jgi:hypothetical protein
VARWNPPGVDENRWKKIAVATWDWLGVGRKRWKKAPDEEVRPAKTFWDLLQLVIVPIVLAVIAITFTNSQAARDRRHEDDRTREDRRLARDAQQAATLQRYIDRMSDLMLDRGLLRSPQARPGVADVAVADVARILTLTTLHRLDSGRKGQVVRFLSESRLLGEPIPEGLTSTATPLPSCCWMAKVNLSGADLRKVDLSKAQLENSSFSGADLTEARFDGARLDNVDFSGASLQKASFRQAQITNSAFNSARLDHATFDDTSILGQERRQRDGTLVSNETVFRSACLNGTRFVAARFAYLPYIAPVKITDPNAPPRKVPPITAPSSDKKAAIFDRSFGRGVDFRRASGLDRVAFGAAHLIVLRTADPGILGHRIGGAPVRTDSFPCRG